MTILIAPIVTEKASAYQEYNKYCFKVDRNATKIDIKKAVAQEYGVTVLSVSTMNVMGKRKSRYLKKGLVEGRRASYKKAVVKVKDGDLIDFYSEL